MSKITFPGGAGGGGAGVSDHGGLAGLADDDHSQYLLMDGTRTNVGLTVTSGQFQAISGNFGYIRIDPVNAIENPGDILQPQDTAALKIFSSTVNNPASGTMFTISDFTNGQGWIVSSGGGSENVRGIALHPRLDSGAGISGIVFGAISNHGTIFRTNNLNRMVISSGGLVGIGTNVPTEALEVAGTVAVQALVSSGGIVLDENQEIFFGASGVPGRSKVSSPSDGNLLVTDAAGTDFGCLQFGGSTNSFPALKRSASSLVVKLADDSSFAGLQASALLVSSEADADGDVALGLALGGKIKWSNAAGTPGGVKDLGLERSGIALLAVNDGTTAGQGSLVANSGIFTEVVPISSGVGQIGTRSLPWASGVFNDGFWIRGPADVTSPGFDRNGGNIRTVAMNGGLTNIESNSLILNTPGSILWGSTQGGFTSPADGEVLVSAAGGTSGVIRAGSGLFNGVILIAPDDSRWGLTVDSSGVLTTTEL